MLTSIVLVCLVSGLLFLVGGDSHYFPTVIVEYPVRIDSFSKLPVSRGKLSLVGVGPPNEKFDKTSKKEGRVSLNEMKKLLQCADIEPELDGNRGSLSMLRMAPPTRKTIENVCAWLESGCFPWSECKRLVEGFKSGNESISRGYHASLIRIKNNEMYYDWPWATDKHREGTEMFRDDLLSLLEMVLQAVQIRDVVFFFGGEQPQFPYRIPVPAFSYASAMRFSDMVFPWVESLKDEYDLYTRAFHANNDFSDVFYSSHHTVWKKRVSKAAYFASYTPSRSMVFDQAVLRPDLIHAGFELPRVTEMMAWNPISDEPVVTGMDFVNNVVNRTEKRPHRQHPGFNQFIYPLSFGGKYHPHHFKYIIVVAMGLDDDSTTGRLASLLAHSGAVILLQETEYTYHFSASLKPWVHYVPLTFNCADLIAKIEWLKAHDDLAQKIVQNAANFGKSYLRLEDYYCYVAQAVDLIAEIELGSDVLVPFNMTRVP